MSQSRKPDVDPIFRRELENTLALTEKEQLIVFIQRWMPSRAALIEKHDLLDQQWRHKHVFSHGFKVQYYSWEYRMLIRIKELVEEMPDA